jgi:hypothetical protein
MLEKDYPWTGKVQACKEDAEKGVIRATGFVNILP